MVPVTVAGVVEFCPHQGKRIGSHHHCGCSVGKTVEGYVAIQCRCDNAAVVAIINSGRSKDALVMHLMRCLFFFQAVFSLSLHAVHLPGKSNVKADCLARDNLPQFRQQVPTASPLQTPLPVELLNALIHHRPDWTSESWKVWFTQCT